MSLETLRYQKIQYINLKYVDSKLLTTGTLGNFYSSKKRAKKSLLKFKNDFILLFFISRGVLFVVCANLTVPTLLYCRV